MNTMTISHTPRGWLLKCVGLSLTLHTAALAFFYFHPLVLQSPLKSLFGMTTATPSLLETNDEQSELQKKKSHLLEEVFQKIVVLSPHFQQPYDLIELPKGIALAPNLEIRPEPPFEISTPDLLSLENAQTFSTISTIQELQDTPFPDLFLPENQGLPIASQLQVDSNSDIALIPSLDAPMGPGNYEDLVSISEFSLNPTFENEYSLNLSPQLISPDSLKMEDLQLKTETRPMTAKVTEQGLNLENEKVRSTLFIPKLTPLLTEKKEIAVESSVVDLSQYQFPSMAMAAEWNDDFEVDVTFLPNPEGRGYIFSLSIQPNYDISSHSLRQNLYFVLDRSSSIQKHRFSVFKRAVLKALASMQQGDTFNIFIMDKKVLTFSPQNRPVSMKNIQAAEEFLDKHEAGGLFNAGEIYASLEKLLPSIPENEEIHTAILLTDGKTGLNNERKQKILKKWVEKNQGKLALYAAAVGRDNDLVSLDMLCSLSGGKLLYSDTHASFPRKLAKLVLNLKDPVAKDLMITAIPHNPHSRIEFYPANSHLPSLYTHQPYTLIGQIDEPCAFDLVIQGRHRSEWIAIKKNVSFIEGQKGNHSLEMDWSAQKANLCYAKFLTEGKSSYLKEAKEILKKSRREIAFE